MPCNEGQFLKTNLEKIGNIGNILTLQLGYCGGLKHHMHMNWYKIKSSYLTKKLLISYLLYKFHVTEAIFTKKTIAIHFPPKSLTGVNLTNTKDCSNWRQKQKRSMLTTIVAITGTSVWPRLLYHRQKFIW